MSYYTYFTGEKTEDTARRTYDSNTASYIQTQYCFYHSMSLIIYFLKNVTPLVSRIVYCMCQLGWTLVLSYEVKHQSECDGIFFKDGIYVYHQ